MPGLYAWVSTVAIPAASTDAPNVARGLAALALTALVVGSLLAMSRPGLGRLIGAILFIVFSAATWTMLGPAVKVERLEPVRAALGGVAWAVFALGWGAVRRPGEVPEDDPRAVAGDPLVARRTLPRGATVIVGASLVLSVIPLFLAWRVLRPEHALLSHAVALAAAIAMVSAGPVIAVERGKWRPRARASQRLSSATITLTLVLVLILVGLVHTLVG